MTADIAILLLSLCCLGLELGLGLRFAPSAQVSSQWKRSRSHAFRLHVADSSASSSDPSSFGLGSNSPYGNYNYSNYWEDIKDVDPRDSIEYQNPLESYPESAEDDAILEELRQKRQIQNDVWQSTLFRDTHGGAFVGSYDVFVPRGKGGQMGLSRIDFGSCASRVTAGPFNASEGVKIFFDESYSSSRTLAREGGSSSGAETLANLLRATRAECRPDEFRTQGGNQVVGCAYTITNLHSSGAYIAELGLRDGPLRVRVRFEYAALSSAGSEIISAEEAQSGQFALALQGLMIVREALDGSSPVEMQPLFSEEQGQTVYDPQVQGDPYTEIRLAPRLTLLYPRGLPRDGSACLTVQWQPRQAMRFQVDRKVEDQLGGIKTLELTEIQPQDADSFPPTYKPVELLK